MTTEEMRSIDRWIAEKVFGITKATWYCGHCRSEVHPSKVTFDERHDERACGCGLPVHSDFKGYTTDPSASRELERKIVEKCGEIMVCYNGMFSVHGALPQRHAIYGPKADTLELALALFAQKLWQK